MLLTYLMHPYERYEEHKARPVLPCAKATRLPSLCQCHWEKHPQPAATRSSHKHIGSAQSRINHVSQPKRSLTASISGSTWPTTDAVNHKSC